MSDSEPKVPVIPAEARTGLAKDAFGPAAKSFGAEIEPLGKELGAVTVVAIRKAIAAGTGVVWQFEQVSEWLREAVSKRLANVPPEEVTEASARILFPASQALVYTGPEVAIREMFANLIASDMKTSTKPSVHPAFVELIKEMTSDDAIVLQHMQKNPAQRIGRLRVNATKKEDDGFHTPYETTSLTIAGFDNHKIMLSVTNLTRLGILSVNDNYPVSPAMEAFEKRVSEIPVVKSSQELAQAEGRRCDFSWQGIHVTNLGDKFMEVCLG